jgi:hypothetical protein
MRNLGSVICVTTHLNGAEYPQQQCLEHDERCIAYTEGKVYSDIFTNVAIATIPAISF